MLQLLERTGSAWRCVTAAIVTLALTLVISASRGTPDDCPAPRLRLAVIVVQNHRPTALMMDNVHQGHIVRTGDWIAGALAVHVDDDSVTLAPNARCTVRYTK